MIYKDYLFIFTNFNLYDGVTSNSRHGILNFLNMECAFLTLYYRKYILAIREYKICIVAATDAKNNILIFNFIICLHKNKSLLNPVYVMAYLKILC